MIITVTLPIHPPPVRRSSMKTFSPLKLPKPSGRTSFETTKVGSVRFDARFQVKSRPGCIFCLEVVSISIIFLPNLVKVSHMVQKMKTGNTETQIAAACSQKPISFSFEESKLKVCRWWVKMYVSHNLQKAQTWRYVRRLNVLIPKKKFFFVKQPPKSGPDHFIFEVSISHSHTHTVGLLWMRDRLVSWVSTYTTNTTDEHPCPQRDSSPRSQQSSGCRHTP